MPFSSLPFIFWYLPVIFLLNLLIQKKYSNPFLALASLFFYFWGESQYTYIFLLSVVINYIFGLLIHKTNGNKMRVAALTFGLIANVLLLFYFKYSTFFIDILNSGAEKLNLQTLANPEVHLPIGISFFTFEAIAYLADVYLKKSKAVRNPIDLLLYMGIFPHLIAGPVIKYSDFENQLHERSITIDGVSEGIKRFIIGLAKKVIIANHLGLIADSVFNGPISATSSNILWIGIVAYSLQLFFDFSGYSDMAIGLGKMFGFTFIENFNYPYISKSVQEFWRRWNISLGIWFRTYIYIPMGGSRVGATRNIFNLIVVFFLTGLWHGAALNFVIWGLFNGIFIVLEKLFLGKLFSKLPAIFSHIYLIFVIMMGWVFFRASNLDEAILYIKGLFSFNYTNPEYLLSSFNNTIFIIALFFAFPFARNFITSWKSKQNSFTIDLALNLGAKFGYMLLFVISVSLIVSSSYNPFIYFRF